MYEANYGLWCIMWYFLSIIGLEFNLCAEGGLQDLVSLVKYKYDQQFPTLGIGRVYWSISDFAFYRC